MKQPYKFYSCWGTQEQPLITSQVYSNDRVGSHSENHSSPNLHKDYIDQLDVITLVTVLCAIRQCQCRLQVTAVLGGALGIVVHCNVLKKLLLLHQGNSSAFFMHRNVDRRSI